jgi:glycosyltransferase involved in cell wall biosynthesis
MMPDMPCTFSVILPCHNAARWIAQSLRSATAQTHAPHEIIVINDASDDDTGQRVRQSGIAVTLLETDFRNAAAARNAGAKAATGDWLAFLDADDYWYPHHLAAAAKLLEGGGDVAYTAYHDELYEGAQAVRRLGNPFIFDHPAAGLTHQDYIRSWRKRIYTSNIATIVQRDRFEAVGGFDPSQLRRHDFELWLRVIFGRTWAVNPRAAAVCRADTPGSISRASAASSAYYSLRGILLNEERYRGTGFEKIVRFVACQSLATAMIEGDREHVARIEPMAWAHLSPLDRAAFRTARLWPGAFAAAVRWRRERAARREGVAG